MVCNASSTSAASTAMNGTSAWTPRSQKTSTLAKSVSPYANCRWRAKRLIGWKNGSTSELFSNTVELSTAQSRIESRNSIGAQTPSSGSRDTRMTWSCWDYWKPTASLYWPTQLKFFTSPTEMKDVSSEWPTTLFSERFSTTDGQKVSLLFSTSGEDQPGKNWLQNEHLVLMTSCFCALLTLCPSYQWTEVICIFHCTCTHCLFVLCATQFLCE